MTGPDDRSDSEFQRLLEGLEHWGSVNSIARRAKVPEAAVRAVIKAMGAPDIAEEICRNAGANEFLLELRSRIQNARDKFVNEAIEVVGKCSPPEGKGPNYDRIYRDAQRDAQDALEETFT